MKKLLTLVIVVSLTAASYAQEFKVGLGGGIYSTWLINTNASDQGDDLDFAATFGGQVGLDMMYYFQDNIGLSFGLLFSGHNQKYQGADQSGNDIYEAKVKIRYLDVPVLLRFGGGSKGAYFEFGPQFGFLMSAKDEFTGKGSLAGVTVSDANTKESLKSSNVSGILGFGVDIEASENVIITTGLRLGYGFTDVTAEYSEAALAAAIAAAPNSISFATAAAHNKQTDTGDTFGYAKTSRAFGGLHIAVLFSLDSKK